MADDDVSIVNNLEEPKPRRVQRRRTELTWYRYIVRVGPRVVIGGITERFEAEQRRAAAFWPGCDVFQIGDPVTLEEAQSWAAQNGYSVDVETSAS